MRRSYGIVALIMLFWFVISFITNIMGPLIPDIIANFKLSHIGLAAFIPTSFFLAILSYVATEQGIANWVSQFLKDYHGLNPQVQGAEIVGLFWGLMSVGCLVGLIVLRLFDSQQVLRVAAILSILLLLISLTGSTAIATISFPALGFTISVMFSIIMSLGLNSVSMHHGSFAGILCTGIVGGAIGPLIIGSLADIIGLKPALFTLLIPLSYILSLSFWAKPLIKNKTVKLRNS